MKTLEKVIVVFLIIVIPSIMLYNAVKQIKGENNLERMNKLCMDITKNLQAQISYNSTCRDYYCYYYPYAPPPGLENTSTLCVCECKLINGTVRHMQVLIPGS